MPCSNSRGATIFIFATTEPQKIPATIHSRCQRYDFRRISVEQVLGRLVHICESEKIAFEKSALTPWRESRRKHARCLSLLDQVSFCQENITEKEVGTVLGLVETEVYERIMDSISSKDPAPPQNCQDILYQAFDLQEFILGFRNTSEISSFPECPAHLRAEALILKPTWCRDSQRAQRGSQTGTC